MKLLFAKFVCFSFALKAIDLDARFFLELEAEKETRRKAAKLRTKKLRIKILSIAVTLIFAALATILQLRKGSVPLKERSEMAETASNKNGAN